ncbi:MAG: hypothetical protein IAE80_05135 [Anaerolinea sp.]|nr:hypothetical protein [Anaerolinea sp.]
MKKLVLLLLSVVLLGAFALPTAAEPAAVPVEDLTALAAYFPEGSLLFAGVRTDDGFIETLDGVIARVGAAFPEMGGFSLSEALDQVASNVKEDASYEELIGAWLGETAAFGIVSMDMSMMGMSDEPVVRVVIDIADREGAEGFFTANTPSRDYDQTIYDGYTVYEHLRGGDAHVLFNDDVIIISNDLASLQNGGAVEFPLNASAAFTEAVGLLPESDYNIVYYQDTPAFLQMSMGMMSMMMEGDMGDVEMFGMGSEEYMQMIEGVMGAIKPQAIGFTILDGSSLVIDGVSPVDLEAMQAAMEGMEGAMGGMGSMTAMDSAPVDLDFVQHIPAGTPLVILGTGMGDALSRIDDSLAMLAEMGEQQGMDFGAQDEPSPEEIQFLIETAVRGITGMSLDEIGLALNGTYALYMGFNPAVEGAETVEDLMSPELLIDFGMAVQVTDPAVAVTLGENLRTNLSALPSDDVTISTEDINGTEALVFTFVPDEDGAPESIDVLLAVNEDVFVVGTRRYVEAALDPAAGLDQDPQWQEAAQYFVPDAVVVLYQSSDNFLPLVDLLAEAPMRDAREAGMFFDVLTGLVSSSSITVGSYGEDVGAFRAVLTLAGE